MYLCINIHANATQSPGKFSKFDPNPQAALLNPLPPLGLAPELRAQVLQADTAVARLRAVGRGWGERLMRDEVMSQFLVSTDLYADFECC